MTKKHGTKLRRSVCVCLWAVFVCVHVRCLDPFIYFPGNSQAFRVNLFTNRALSVHSDLIGEWVVLLMTSTSVQLYCFVWMLN